MQHVMSKAVCFRLIGFETEMVCGVWCCSYCAAVYGIIGRVRNLLREDFHCDDEKAN